PLATHQQRALLAVVGRIQTRQVRGEVDQYRGAARTLADLQSGADVRTQLRVERHPPAPVVPGAFRRGAFSSVAPGGMLHAEHLRRRGRARGASAPRSPDDACTRTPLGT